VNQAIGTPATFHHGPVQWPAIVVHGGAGDYRRAFQGGAEGAGIVEELVRGVDDALDAGWQVLEVGGEPLAAAVAAVSSFEQDGGFNAGRGSVPTTAGTVEMDAGVMDGAGQAGGVACISHHSAIHAAMAVHAMEEALLLVGPRADELAERAGVPTLTPLRTSGVADPTAFGADLSTHGTVGAVAVSADGRFGAATSTGGRGGQPPGRIGDSPIPGCGVWAQPDAAVSATGNGEAFILAGFSRLVAERHAAGLALPDALQAGLDAVAGYGGNGGGIALASDRTWVAGWSARAMAHGVRHAAGRLADIR
jgi:beta-aspartyl-peptidase (threonine type)